MSDKSTATSSSITTTNQSKADGSLPIEYQVRPNNLAPPRESPLSGLAANPYRPRTIWWELWKSKLAFFLLISSSTFIYMDYQRTQRYKAEKALKAASDSNSSQNQETKKTTSKTGT